MKVLVTGADGFVGRHLVRELLERGYQVRAAIRSGSEPVSFPEGVDTVPLELEDGASVIAALTAPCDAIVHLAASHRARKHAATRRPRGS